MKKKILILTALLLFVSGLSYYFSRAEQIEAQKATELKLSGNVDVREVTLAFSQSGRISEIFFEEGDAVAKDQLLAKLDSREIELQIQYSKSRILAQENAVALLRNGTRREEILQYEEKLKAATANAEYLRGVRDRLQKIFDDIEGVSRQELDNAISQSLAADAAMAEAQQAYSAAVAGPRVEEIQQAEATLTGLRDELARLEYILSQYELKSPANGVIRSRLLEVGDMASPTAPVFSISLNTKKWVRAYVKETELGKIFEGKPARVFIDSLPDEILSGQIGYISSTAEFTPKTVQTDELRTSLVYEIRVYVADEKNILRMGMPATVRIDIQ